MSGLMHKMKDAISGDKNTENTGANQSGNGDTAYNPFPKLVLIHPTEYGHGTGSHGTTAASTTGSRFSGANNTGPGLTGSDTGYGSGSTTAGPHSSNLGNKADPRVDSDLDGSNRHGTTGSGLTGHDDSTGYGSHGTGSGLTGRNDNTGFGTGSTTAGPHSSSLGNKADPRVDSDLDGSNRQGYGGTGSGVIGSNTPGTGYDSSRGATGSGLTGTGTGHHGHHGGVGGKVDDLVHGGEHHTETANRLDPHVAGGQGSIEHATVGGGSGSGLGSSTAGEYGTSNTTAGPHSSNLANKADPRVDSDLDGSRGYGSSTATGGYDSSTGSGLTGSRDHTGTTSGYGSSNTTTAGPHNSGMMNKADPRVDSDLDGSRGLGSSNTTGSTGGYGSSTGTHGTTGGYGSNTGTGSGYGDNTTSSTGTGSTTAGPHNSNMTNKLDPRVDSDLDGSKMK